jgi:hypothetical protein
MAQLPGSFHSIAERVKGVIGGSALFRKPQLGAFMHVYALRAGQEAHRAADGHGVADDAQEVSRGSTGTLPNKWVLCLLKRK